MISTEEELVEVTVPNTQVFIEDKDGESVNEKNQPLNFCSFDDLTSVFL